MKTSFVFFGLCAILAVVLFPDNASGIQCYVCNNYVHKTGCGHGKDVSDEYLVDCNNLTPGDGGVSGSNYDLCRKIVTSIEFDVNNNTATERIDRRCGHLDSKYDEECYYRGGFGGRQRTCSCKTDKCNGGFSVGVNFALIATALFTAAGVYKL